MQQVKAKYESQGLESACVRHIDSERRETESSPFKDVSIPHQTANKSLEMLRSPFGGFKSGDAQEC